MIINVTIICDYRSSGMQAWRLIRKEKKRNTGGKGSNRRRAWNFAITL